MTTAAADLDDSSRRKRIRVSLYNNNMYYYCMAQRLALTNAVRPCRIAAMIKGGQLS